MRKQLSYLLVSCFAVAGLSNAAPITEPPQFSVDKPRSEYTTNAILDATEKAKLNCTTGTQAIAGLICISVPTSWAEIEADPARWRDVKVKLWNASIDDINDTIDERTKPVLLSL